MADKMRLCRHHRKPLKRHNAIGADILYCAPFGLGRGLGRTRSARKPAAPVVPAVFASGAGRRCQPRCTAGSRPCHTAAMATANRLTRSPLVHRLVINPFVFRLIFTSFATTRFASQTRLLGGDDWLFFNYGYEEDPPMGIPLDAADEPHRYFIQLYHRTATQVDLSGKRVLECSCGHGGGASYLVRTQHPASYTGLDLNPAGIEFAKTGTTCPTWISWRATPRLCPSPTNLRRAGQRRGPLGSSPVRCRKPGAECAPDMRPRRHGRSCTPVPAFRLRSTWVAVR